MRFPVLPITITFSAIHLLITCAGSAQTTDRVSVDSLGEQGDGESSKSVISADGIFVTFQSISANLVPGDTNGKTDVFLHNRITGTTERVSVDSLGLEGNKASLNPVISGDGRYVAFESKAGNLVGGDNNRGNDVFVHDRQTGTTECVSVNALGQFVNNGPSARPAISADGRYVAFKSFAGNLVAGDTNGLADVFVYDRQTGTTIRVSVSSSGLQGDKKSDWPSISENGRFLAFHSHARNLVPADLNGYDDIFVHDRQTGLTERVSVNSQGREANWYNLHPSISADGRYVSFQSFANNLVPSDTNGLNDTFVHDRQTGITERVSVDSLGAQGNGGSWVSVISANGRYVALSSKFNNLVPEDYNNFLDTFVHDRQTGTTERVSVDSYGIEANSPAAHGWPSISGDGRYVTFSSYDDNLVFDDTNLAVDVFVHDRWDGKGQNSIYLSGPFPPRVGDTITFDWQGARPNSDYWLIRSMNNNGSVIGWTQHVLGVGRPYWIMATGQNSSKGMGTFTSAPIPAPASGQTLYFEVVAREAVGLLYDSNVVVVQVQ